jgi:hypothetical protein
MKLEAVFKPGGTILAAIAYEDDDSGSHPRPIAPRGARADIFDIPREFANIPLDELCRRTRVDAKRGRLVAGNLPRELESNKAKGERKRATTPNRKRSK